VTLSPTKTIPVGVPDNVKKFLKGWMSSGGRYVNYDNIAGHELLDLEAYIHITSPIRRLVDLLNIMNLQDKLDICKYSEKSKIFYNKWGESLEYINTTMRAIRKVQNDCSLLNMFADKQQLLEKEYDGFIFESIERNDGLFQYLVYLPQLNMTNRITLRHRLANNTTHQFKIFIFMDEERLKQKIRLEYIPK
jgi:exoribonuclease R